MCDSTQAVQQVDEMKHNINSVSPTGKLPCMDNYPGPYDFEVILEETSHKRSWVVSVIIFSNACMWVTHCCLYMWVTYCFSYFNIFKN